MTREPTMTSMFQIGVDNSHPGEIWLVAALHGRVMRLSDKNYPSINAAFEDLCINMQTLMGTDLTALCDGVNFLRGFANGVSSRIDSMEKRWLNK